MAETTPRIGDHVALMWTNIAADVQRIDRSLGRDQVSFKVTAVPGTSGTSKAARAFRGAWITCGPELLVTQMAASRGSTGTATALDGVLRSQVERLVSEFAEQSSREQVERHVASMASRYAHARITTFVPTLVYRDARSVLSGRRATPQ